MNEFQQQQTSVLNNAMMQRQLQFDMPIPEGPSNDFFRYRIDGGDILEELEHQLKGEIYSSKEKKFIPKFNQELTDEGINEIINIVYSMGLNKNIILGNLSHEEIYTRCTKIWLELAKYFVKQGRNIGVTEANRGMLTQKIIFIIHSGLSRSEEGNEARQLSTASQKIEHSYVDSSPQKSSFSLGGLFGGRKR